MFAYLLLVRVIVRSLETPVGLVHLAVTVTLKTSELLGPDGMTRMTSVMMVVPLKFVDVVPTARLVSPSARSNSERSFTEICSLSFVLKMPDVTIIKVAKSPRRMMTITATPISTSTKENPLLRL